jgi:hypothetical protein
MNNLTKIPTNHIIIRKRLAEEQARIKEVQKRLAEDIYNELNFKYSEQ